MAILQSTTVNGILNITSLTGSQNDLVIISTTGSISRTSSTAFIVSGSTNSFNQNGNIFGATAVLGTTDNYGLQFETNNSTKLTVTTAGYVGIGIINPQYKLDIVGDIRMVGNGLFINSGVDNGYIYFGTTTNNWIRGGGNGLELFVNGSIRTIINPSGNVGIGTVSPTGLLHIYNGNAGNNNLQLQFQASGGGNWAINPFIVGISNGGLSFVDILNNRTPFVINASANVGIGTATPTAKLHIMNTASSVDVFKVTNAIGNYTINDYNFNAPSSFLIKAGGYLLLSSSGNPLYFSINNGSSYQMNIDTSGNVGIGTISQTQKLHIYDPTTAHVVIQGNDAGAPSRSSILRLKGTTIGRAQGIIMDSGGTESWFMGQGYGVNGNFTIGYGSTLPEYATQSKIMIDTTGNIGVGTSTPNEILHLSAEEHGDEVTVFIENRGYITGANSKLLLSTKGTDGNPHQISIRNAQSQTTAGNMIFNTDGSDRLSILNNGNVGIGTITPSYMLDVNGNANITGNILASNLNISNWNTAYGWGDHTTANYTSNTRTLTINGITYDLTTNRTWLVGDLSSSSSYANPSWITSLEGSKITGNVGTASFATTASYATFANGVTFSNITSKPTTITGYGITDGFMRDGNSFGARAVLGTNDSQMLEFKTNNTSRLSISATETKIGIGITSPLYALHVVSGATISAKFDGRIIGATAINDNELTTYGQISSILVEKSNNVLHTDVTNYNTTYNLVLSSISSGTTHSSILHANSITYNPFTGVLTVPTISATTYVGLTGGSGGSGSTYSFLQNGNTFGVTASIGTIDNKALSFITNNTAKMTINTNGFIGIGNTNPSYSLDVRGNLRVGGLTASDNFIKIGAGRSNNGYAYIDLIGDTTYNGISAAAGFRIIRSNNGADAATDLQHMGIGNFNITNINAADMIFKINNTEKVKINSTGIIIQGDDSLQSTGTLNIKTNANNPIVMKINGTETTRFDENGILVTSTTPPSTNPAGMYIYLDANGYLKARGSNGTITTLATP